MFLAFWLKNWLWGKCQGDGSTNFWLTPKSASDFASLVTVCADLEIPPFFGQIYGYGQNIGSPFYAWNKATVETMETLWLASSKESKGRPVDRESRGIGFIGCRWNFNGGFSSKGSYSNWTVLWNLGVTVTGQYHGPTAWKVNQRGTVPSGHCHRTQVICRLDNNSRLRLWTYWSTVTFFSPGTIGLPSVPKPERAPGWKHFTTDDAVMAAAGAYLNMQDKAFFQASIAALQWR